MKPFNLEAALRGEKVVTRDGREVTQLMKFDAPHTVNTVVGVQEGYVTCWSVEGASVRGLEMQNDLVMYEEPTIWKPSACCSFRWFKPQVGSPRLQQMYVNQLEPEYEWRDVPIVREDPDV